MLSINTFDEHKNFKVSSMHDEDKKRKGKLINSQRTNKTLKKSWQLKNQRASAVPGWGSLHEVHWASLPLIQRQEHLYKDKDDRINQAARLTMKCDNDVIKQAQEQILKMDQYL